MVITSTLRCAPWMFTASTAKDLYAGSGTSRVVRVSTWNSQIPSWLTRKVAASDPSRGRAFLTKLHVPRRSARDQLWNVRRVMPRFNNSAQVQFLGQDAVANGGEFVAHRLGIERADSGDRWFVGDGRTCKARSYFIRTTADYTSLYGVHR